jgi:hypothetical protein
VNILHMFQAPPVRTGPAQMGGAGGHADPEPVRLHGRCKMAIPQLASQTFTNESPALAPYCPPGRGAGDLRVHISEYVRGASWRRN